jgi:hypothetical protein
VLSWLGRALFRLKGVKDFHCGIRGFHRDRIRELRLCMPGMEFASELVVRASLSGYQMTEVPTTLRPDGRSRPPHLRTWRDGWRHLRFLLVFAPRPALVWPGLIVFLLGLVSTVALAFGPRTIGDVRFDINALAYACVAILVGFQLILFGGFAELYGRFEGLVRDHDLSRWARWLSFERCVALGLGVIALGVAGTIAALADWGATGFGNLDPRGTIRLVLPSATAIAIGVVGVFAGLLTLRGVRTDTVLTERLPRQRSRDLAAAATAPKS